MFKGNICDETATQETRRKLERQINILSIRQVPTSYSNSNWSSHLLLTVMKKNNMHHIIYGTKMRRLQLSICSWIITWQMNNCQVFMISKYNIYMNIILVTMCLISMWNIYHWTLRKKQNIIDKFVSIHSTILWSSNKINFSKRLSPEWSLRVWITIL